MLADLALLALLHNEPAEPPDGTEPVTFVVAAEDEPETAPTTPDTVVPLPPGEAPAALRSMIFPVLGPVIYADTFGDCRDSCSRLHQGIDLLGVQMQPLVATVGGTITRLVHEGARSGNGIVITDAEGWSYVYYHVNNDPPGDQPLATTEATVDAEERWRMPAGLTEGSTVTPGQVIGWMGNSGNAEHSVDHLHFEIRDPEGEPINPYTSLRAAEFVDRCRPAFQRPAPVMSPPHVVQGTIFRFPTSTGLGSFVISATGGVLAEGDAASIGNPNYPVVSCDEPVPLHLARAVPDPEAEQPEDTTTVPETSTSAPETTTPTTDGSTTTASPDTTAPGASTPGTTVPGSTTSTTTTTTPAPTTPAPTTTLQDIITVLTTLV